MLNDFIQDLLGCYDFFVRHDYAHFEFFRTILLVCSVLIFLLCVSASVVALVIACCKTASRFIK